MACYIWCSKSSLTWRLVLWLYYIVCAFVRRQWWWWLVYEESENVFFSPFYHHFSSTHSTFWRALLFAYNSMDVYCCCSASFWISGAADKTWMKLKLQAAVVIVCMLVWWWKGVAFQHFSASFLFSYISVLPAKAQFWILNKTKCVGTAC